jgi:hypothetical protein
LRLIFEAATNTIAHPSFDAGLPRQIVLVTSGDLRGNARLAVQNLNDGLLRELGRLPVLCWSGQNLSDFFIEHGLSGVHRATAEGFVDYGRFFLAYAHAVQGTLTDRDIEEYSRQWPDPTIPLDRRLLRAAVETEILAQRCADRGNYWEAVTGHLALLRVLCAATYTDAETDLTETFNEGVRRLHELGLGFLNEIRAAWGPQQDLFATPFGALDVTTYLVHCARIAELASIVYLTTPIDQDREQFLSFLEDFVRSEPGCAHPLSDRYAVSLVRMALVLLEARRDERVQELIRQATVWLCDRYQYGMGLAAFHVDELEETKTLLGYPFDFITLSERRDSFLAAALSDLAAFTGDRELYEAVVNDIKACRIVPQYFQARDTVGACSIEGADVLVYPSVGYEDELTAFEGFRFANSFQFVDAFGPTAAMLLSSLLRDRFFPKLWLQLTSRSGPNG